MKYLLFVSFIMFGCYQTKVATPIEEMSGKVIKIVDGDTYDILFDNHATKRIRMAGIDAPERGMPFYKIAKDYLGTLCFGKTVRIEQTNRDKYNRVVAKTFLDNGGELGLLMIENGYAWHYRDYSSDLKLAEAETEARHSRKGIWADENPQAPWERRK